MKIGYIRISTQDQNYNLQEDALNKLGCEMIFKETISGAKRERPQLKKLLEQIRKGDVVVVYKLDRLGRSLKHLLEIVEILNSKNVALQSLHDNIDTTTPQGRLFSIFQHLLQNLKRILSEKEQKQVWKLQGKEVRKEVAGKD